MQSMQLNLKNAKAALRCSMNVELNMDQYVAPMNGLARKCNAIDRHACRGAAFSGRFKLCQPLMNARLKMPRRPVMVVARYVRRPYRAPTQQVTQQ